MFGWELTRCPSLWNNHHLLIVIARQKPKAWKVFSMMYSKNCSLTFLNKNKSFCFGSDLFFFFNTSPHGECLWIALLLIPSLSEAIWLWAFWVFSLLSEKVASLLCPGALCPSSAARHFDGEHACLRSSTHWVSSLPFFISLTSCHSHISQSCLWGRRTMPNTAGAVRINNSFNHKLINDDAAWGEGEEKNEH